MRIEQLLTFKRVADERSYTRAAEKEFLSQPSVYSQVRQMETECGAKLFYVAGKEVLLTAAGKDLYRLADTVAGAYQEFLSGFRTRAETRIHSVRIGALSYFGVLAEATEQLRNDDPQCVVNFESLHPTEAIDMIRAGAIDFGFFGDSFVLEGLVKEQVAENRIVAVAPPSHPLVGHVVTFAELTKFAVVGYAAGSARSALERWLQSHPEQAVRYSAQSDSSLAVKSMALAMGSAAFIVRGAIGDELSKGELVELDVVDFDVSYPLYAVYSSLENLGEGARRYLDQLRAIWSRIQKRAAERALC